MGVRAVNAALELPGTNRSLRGFVHLENESAVSSPSASSEPTLPPEASHPRNVQVVS